MTLESNPTGTESVPTRRVQKVSGLEFTAVLYSTRVQSRSILLSRQVWEFCGSLPHLTQRLLPRRNEKKVPNKRMIIQ